MQEIILKISILKDYQIAFPFNGEAYVMKNKRGMKLVTSRSSGYKISSQ